MRFIFTFLFLSLIGISYGQIETASIMQYNLMNYRNNAPGCNNSNNDPTKKEAYFKTIAKHVKPDIICLNEIGNSFTNANDLVTKSLNTDGVTKYQQCNFSATPGSSLTNMLIYNQEKFGLHKQDKIEKAPDNSSIVRLIDVYYLYFKDPNLSQTKDTTFLVFFVGHFKAGTGSFNRTSREKAAKAVIQYINNNDVKHNYFLAGDFNIYGASEPAYQELTVTPDANTRLYDPLTAPGEWNNNSNFAFLHTQSTRTSSGCFSGGGMDDRFDFILMSKSIKDKLHRVEYIKNSYRAVGQDGNRFNGSVSFPTNSSEPSKVIDALYNLSDHLPTVMNISITLTKPNSIADRSQKFDLYINNPVSETLKIRLETNKNEQIKGEIYSITGKIVKTFSLNEHNDSFYKNINTNDLPKGIYILKLKSDSGFETARKLLLI